MSQSPAPPTPPAESAGEFTFTEQVKKPSAKSIFKQPVTIAAIVLTLAVVGFVLYLEAGHSSSLPEIEVTYELLPNAGKSDGVPIAIKLNDIAVFIISDPLEGGTGATRAQGVVDSLQESVTILKEEPGKIVTLDESGELPSIVQQAKDGTERRLLINITEDDLKIAGETNPKRLARVWAERLTDTVKLIAFGEAPEYSTGTEFGDAMGTLYAAARQKGGSVSEGSLEEAFEILNDSQKLVLETVPTLPQVAETESDKAVLESGKTFK